MPKFNKRAGKPLTKATLRDAALRYVGRYAATRAMLERNLANHVMRATRAGMAFSQNEAKTWTHEIVDFCEAKGFVNDDSYADMVVRQGRSAGWSGMKISQKLYVKGVKREAIREKLADSDEDDLEAALVFVKRKAIGPYRRNDEADRKKEMEKICRGGFSPEIARKIMKMDKDQCAALLIELRTK